jgi:hypothetical protein
MFAVTSEDLAVPVILDCCAGGSSFTAEAAGRFAADLPRLLPPAVHLGEPPQQALANWSGSLAVWSASTDRRPGHRPPGALPR